MNKSLLMFALSAAFVGSTFAQTAAAPAAAPAAAAVTAVCKDGTPFSGDTLKGACRGHGGVDKKAAAASGAAPAAKAAPAATSAAPAAKASPAAKADAMAAAPGGGADKVWVNEGGSKVYHCMGDKFYGKTKKGEYMTEADAKTKGFHGDHGKACSK